MQDTAARSWGVSEVGGGAIRKAEPQLSSLCDNLAEAAPRLDSELHSILDREERVSCNNLSPTFSARAFASRISQGM